MWDINIWSDEKLREMKTNVIVLMNAAGDSYGALDLSKKHTRNDRNIPGWNRKEKGMEIEKSPKATRAGSNKGNEIPINSKM